MNKIEIYQNLEGVDCVMWTDDYGMHSMLKTAYDAMQAEQSTPSVIDEA
jgi:hypothetical protein